MLILIVYLLIINFLGLYMMRDDKMRAMHKKWRISEKALFTVGVLGGSMGILVGMYLFRHKTKHWYFVVGMPFILILQVVLMSWIFWKFF